MLVTDVAARGIDIPLLDNAIHYDAPAAPKLFVHRSGRVARAGRKGNAYVLVSTNELPYVLDIHLLLGRKLKAAGSQNDGDDGDNDSGGNIGDGGPGEMIALVQLLIASLKFFVGECNTSCPLNFGTADESSILGKLPQDTIDFTQESIQKTVGDSVSLSALQKVAERAMKLYVRTRAAPSKESVARGKVLHTREEKSSVSPFPHAR